MNTGWNPEPKTHSDGSPARTVVALASAPGTAAIGAIQLAGPGAKGILRRYLRPGTLPALHEIKRRHLLDHARRAVDEVLVTCLDDHVPIFEITCHGGLRILQRIIEVFREAGAEPASPDALVKDVYRLDHPIAGDAYRLLPHARTALAVKFLLHQAHEGLARLYDSIQAGDADKNDLQNALRYFPAVRYLITGLNIVIVGPANAGKSTLLNTLAEHERALVDERPGTTRDYVQADLEIAGLPVTVTDTAGLGPTGDPLAAQAYEKTRQAAEAADLAIILLDVVNPDSLADQFAETMHVPAVRKLADEQKVIVLLNKIDRPDRIHQLGDLDVALPKREISALTGENIIALEESIRTLAGLNDFEIRTPTAFTTAHVDLIQRNL